MKTSIEAPIANQASDWIDNAFDIGAAYVRQLCLPEKKNQTSESVDKGSDASNNVNLGTFRFYSRDCCVVQFRHGSLGSVEILSRAPLVSPRSGEAPPLPDPRKKVARAPVPPLPPMD